MLDAVKRDEGYNRCAAKRDKRYDRCAVKRDEDYNRCVFRLYGYCENSQKDEGRNPKTGIHEITLYYLLLESKPQLPPYQPHSRIG